MFNKKIISDIKAKFQVTKHSSRPTVNEKLDNSFDRTNLEIACLITNYKEIYFTSKIKVLNKLHPLLRQPFLKLKRIDYLQYFLSKPTCINQKIIMIPHYSTEKRTILYTNKGTRQAFLLFLRDIELNLNEFYQPGSWAESDNHYLTGFLLSYPKKDMLFFYKIAAFKEHLTSSHKFKIFKITEIKSFASWPEEIKEQFYDFLKVGWLKSTSYTLYKRDRKEANAWLKKTETISLKKLKLKIEELKTQITLLNQNYRSVHKIFP